GCFWCLEAVFELVKGVNKVVSGYAGGSVAEPTYEEVCTGTTGHAEVVQITFDPAQVTFRQLLEIFFTIHDPTTLTRQGNHAAILGNRIVPGSSSRRWPSFARSFIRWRFSAALHCKRRRSNIGNKKQSGHRRAARDQDRRVSRGHDPGGGGGADAGRAQGAHP